MKEPSVSDQINSFKEKISIDFSVKTDTERFVDTLVHTLLDKYTATEEGLHSVEALFVEKQLSGVKRHPSIGNHVTIYANATILGGATHIGDYAIIGGNTWVTESVPPHATVYHKPEITIKAKR